MQLKTVLLAGSLAFLAGGCSSSPSNGAAGSGGSTNSGGTGQATRAARGATREPEGARRMRSIAPASGQAGALTRLREATVGVCQSKGTETGLAEANASTMKLTFTESHFVNCGTAQDSTEPYQEEYSYVIGSVPVDEWSPLGIKLEIQQINCPGYCESKSLAKIQ